MNSFVQSVQFPQMGAGVKENPKKEKRRAVINRAAQ